MAGYQQRLRFASELKSVLAEESYPVEALRNAAMTESSITIPLAKLKWISVGNAPLKGEFESLLHTVEQILPNYSELWESHRATDSRETPAWK